MSEKLLIVDDEAELAEILGALLEDFYECEAFARPHDALIAFEERKHALVITDLEMPETDGLAFLRAARPMSPSTRFYISTGHDRGHPRVQAALAAGACDVIPKPFAEISSLLKILRSRPGTSEV